MTVYLPGVSWGFGPLWGVVRAWGGRGGTEVGPERDWEVGGVRQGTDGADDEGPGSSQSLDGGLLGDR